MPKREKEIKKDIIIYQSKTGAIELRGDFEKETIWATQAEIARIFGVNTQAITKHVKNLYGEKELSRKATCSKMEQVRKEGNRIVKRSLEIYNLDVLIAVGYRINSVVGTKFRQWATKVLRQHITEGYTVNPNRIKLHYAEFMEAVENMKKLLPQGANIDGQSVLELVTAFADTWLSLDAYDKDKLIGKGSTKKEVEITAQSMQKALEGFKSELSKKGEVSDLFGIEKEKEAISGIVGNVMQSFGGAPVYPTVEEKAAHLLYFMVKNHPFIDGNKRSGAYAFIWFLKKAGILNMAKMTPAALTALTLFVAESDPKNKDRMIRLVLQLLKK